MDRQILAQVTIEALLLRWPETATVFQKRQMACAGCVVAPFYTVQDAAEVYQIPPEELVGDLVDAIENAPSDSEDDPPAN